MLVQKDKKTSTCKHCGVRITHYMGRLWHDSHLVFPQYCMTTPQSQGSQMHEPVDE